MFKYFIEYGSPLVLLSLYSRNQRGCVNSVHKVNTKYRRDRVSLYTGKFTKCIQSPSFIVELQGSGRIEVFRVSVSFESHLSSSTISRNLKF